MILIVFTSEIKIVLIKMLFYALESMSFLRKMASYFTTVSNILSRNSRKEEGVRLIYRWDYCLDINIGE